MQSFPDLDKKLAERHRVIFGTIETVRGETVRAVSFPDIGFIIAGSAMQRVTLEQAMKFADQFAPPKKMERAAPQNDDYCGGPWSHTGCARERGTRKTSCQKYPACFERVGSAFFGQVCS